MIVQSTEGVRVLSPVAEPLWGTKVVAPRLKDLNGKTVGLLSNGKRNTARILELLSEMLGESYQLREVISDTGSHLVPHKDVTNRMAGQCDVVLVGVGD
jgi:hypothetical protein